MMWVTCKDWQAVPDELCGGVDRPLDGSWKGRHLGKLIANSGDLVESEDLVINPTATRMLQEDLILSKEVSPSWSREVIARKDIRTALGLEMVFLSVEEEQWAEDLKKEKKLVVLDERNFTENRELPLLTRPLGSLVDTSKIPAVKNETLLRSLSGLEGKVLYEERTGPLYQDRAGGVLLEEYPGRDLGKIGTLP